MSSFSFKNFVLKKRKAAVSKVVIFLAKSFSKQIITLSGYTNPELHNLQIFFIKSNLHYKPKLGFSHVFKQNYMKPLSKNSTS